MRWIEKGIKRSVELAKHLFLPQDLYQDPDSFTKEQIKALSDRRTISKMLFYRSYVETEDGYGFYIQADGRIGVVFQIFPPAYLNAEVENDLISMLNTVMIDDAVAHIITYARRNIDEILDVYEKCHSASGTIKFPNVLRDFTNEQKEFYKRWTKESILGNEADLRVRNFVNLVSILFPYDTDEFVIKQTYNQLLGVLAPYKARVMDASELIPLLKEILNPSLGYYPKSNDTITNINKQVTKNLEIRLDQNDGTLHLNDGWRAKVLTTDKYPDHVDIFTYQNHFFDAFGKDFQIHLPCPFLLSLTISFKNIEKQRKEVLAKARWNLSQLSGMPEMVYKKRPQLRERRDENEEVIYYLEKLGEIPLDAMWTLTVFEENEKRLERYIASIKRSFQSIHGQWILKEERFSQIALQTLLMSLPLQYSEIVHTNIDRFDKNFRSNNAQIAPLIGDFHGNGLPYFLYLGRTGQIISIDIFNSDNYNICVVGPQGSGKSFWANAFLAQALASGWQVRMIDFGRSYKKFCEIVGGQFVEFKERTRVCLNFFTNIQTEVKQIGGVRKEVIKEEELELLVPIVGYMAQLDLSDIYKQKSDKLEMTLLANFISKSIQRAFEIKGRDAGMREVVEALEDFSAEAKERGEDEIANLLTKLTLSLAPYADEERDLFYMFNGTNNINFDNDYFILELEELARSGVKPVVAMVFLQNVAQEAFIRYEQNKNTKRIIGVDEAWQILKDPLFAKFLEDFARRIRKYNGATLIITQTLDEFFNNTQAQVVFKTSDWKIFLPHSKEQLEQAVSSGKLILDEFDIQLFRSLKSRYPYYSEFFVKHKKREFVSLLKTTPYGYWLFTTNPDDRAEIDNVMKRYDLSIQEAIWYLARLDEGYSEEKILSELSNKHRAVKVSDWMHFFKSALGNDLFEISTEPVIDIESKQVEYYEALPIIVYKNVPMRAREWLYYAKELGLFMEIEAHFYKKVLSEYKSNIALNIDLDGIRSKKFFNFLDSLSKGAKFLLEVNLDVLAESNPDTIFSFVNDMRKRGIGVVFDNVKLDQLDFLKLKHRPAYLKIPVSQFRLNVENRLLQHMMQLLQQQGIRIIATYVESKEDIAAATQFGVRLMQGYFIKDNYRRSDERG